LRPDVLRHKLPGYPRPHRYRGMSLLTVWLEVRGTPLACQENAPLCALGLALFTGEGRTRSLRDWRFRRVIAQPGCARSGSEFRERVMSKKSALRTNKQLVGCPDIPTPKK